MATISDFTINIINEFYGHNFPIDYSIMTEKIKMLFELEASFDEEIPGLTDIIIEDLNMNNMAVAIYMISHRIGRLLFPGRLNFHFGDKIIDCREHAVNIISDKIQEYSFATVINSKLLDTCEQLIQKLRFDDSQCSEVYMKLSANIPYDGYHRQIIKVTKTIAKQVDFLFECMENNDIEINSICGGDPEFPFELIELEFLPIRNVIDPPLIHKYIDRECNILDTIYFHILSFIFSRNKVKICDISPILIDSSKQRIFTQIELIDSKRNLLHNISVPPSGFTVNSYNDNKYFISPKDTSDYEWLKIMVNLNNPEVEERFEYDTILIK